MSFLEQTCICPWGSSVSFDGKGFVAPASLVLICQVSSKSTSPDQHRDPSVIPYRSIAASFADDWKGSLDTPLPGINC